jgi:hypothetical protein
VHFSLKTLNELIMETYNSEKLTKYRVNGQEIIVGFAKYRDAESYASEKGGEIVEVGFLDGNDNPQVTDEAGLIKRKLHYHADAGPEYKFIHSSDPGFRHYADDLQKVKSAADKLSPEEKYIANAELEIAEDPIIVLKDDRFESVTSRERSKYLKHTKVYEIGVAKPL